MEVPRCPGRQQDGGGFVWWMLPRAFPPPRWVETLPHKRSSQVSLVDWAMVSTWTLKCMAMFAFL